MYDNMYSWCECVFFFNDTATTEIYTLSLHDALPISACGRQTHSAPCTGSPSHDHPSAGDRKSTRLNSSHGSISYAVFCLKKKQDDISQTAGYTVIQNGARHYLSWILHFIADVAHVFFFKIVVPADLTSFPHTEPFPT